MEYFTIGLIAFCQLVTLAFLFYCDNRQWSRIEAVLEYERAERKELLNRIMAKSLTEHVQAEVAEKVTYQQPEPERDYDLSEVGM